MNKDFEIQMSCLIRFDDNEGVTVEISLSEPEYVAIKGKEASKVYMASIGKNTWEKQIERIGKVFVSKHLSYLSLVNSLKENWEFFKNKRDRCFVVIFSSEADNKEIGEAIDKFYKYILEECCVTFH